MCCARSSTQLPCAARQRLPLNLRSEKSDGSVHCTCTGPSAGRLRGASGSVTLRDLAVAVAVASRTTTSKSRRAERLMGRLRCEHDESALAGLNRARPWRPRMRSRRAAGRPRNDAARFPLPDTRINPLISALVALALCLAATSAHAADGAAALGPETVNNATGTDQAALLRAQVLLERARFSPGEIDGGAGTNTSRAIAAFQRARDLEPSGKLDEATWQALAAGAAPALVSHTLTDEDVAGPFPKIPDDTMEKAKLDALGYTSVEEALAEKFHVAPRLIAQLNPGKPLQAGTALVVPNLADLASLAPAATVVVD